MRALVAGALLGLSVRACEAKRATKLDVSLPTVAPGSYDVTVKNPDGGITTYAWAGGIIQWVPGQERISHKMHSCPCERLPPAVAIACFCPDDGGSR